MSYETTCDTWEEFLGEWEPDNLNIPVKLWLDHTEKYCSIAFAHPRKLTMSKVSIKDFDFKLVREWFDKNAKPVVSEWKAKN